ncbi:MAG: hypothetical protein RKK15_10160 [Defluviicoccus sp.]|nr:hypothetical protein [Defluviicoccus sp.]
MITPLPQLRETVQARARHALACGALRPIETEQRFIDDGGIRFVIRMVSSLREKAERQAQNLAAALQSGRQHNPFLPYDEDLFVARLAPAHVCLLNKFNVIDHHLLIVTSTYEDQEMLLTEGDFAALKVCLDALGGLGFYNGGSCAGASQPHKHLQLIPLPIADAGPAIPIAPLLTAVGNDGPTALPGLPFRHAFARLGADHAGTSATAIGTWAAAANALYRRALAATGIGAVACAGGERQGAPYNFLMTHAWMLVVPRTREVFEGISVNALGFAGSLFVRDARELAILERAGPMAALRQVGVSDS